MWIIGEGKNRRGRLVYWVEKESLEKIRRLLEISEQGCHYEVLLTLKNLVDVRRNPTLYTLSIIPRPLPSEIVDGEHFVTIDLLNLTTGSGFSSRVLDAETSSRELVSRTLSGSSASTNRGSGYALCAFSWGERGHCPESLPLPRKGTSSAPWVLKSKKGGTS